MIAPLWSPETEFVLDGARRELRAAENEARLFDQHQPTLDRAALARQVVAECHEAHSKAVWAEMYAEVGKI